MGLTYYKPATRTRGAHANIINSRLLNWQLIDAAGIQSDQLTLVVSTEGLDGLPAEGEKIGFEVGYDENSLIDKGMFVITRITPRLFPSEVTIVATAAPFVAEDKTDFKQRRTRSFSQITLGDIFRQIAVEHQLSPRIAAELDKIYCDHLDQSDETDMNFLTRVAQMFDAVVKPVDGLFVLARKGQVTSISGKPLQLSKYSLQGNNKPGHKGFINASVDFASRPQFKGVQTSYWDVSMSSKQTVNLGSPPYKIIQQQAMSMELAMETASCEQQKLSRSGITINLDLPGNPLLVAESLIELDDTFPAYMQGQWSIERVTSTSNRSQGYRCAVTAVPIEGKQ